MDSASIVKVDDEPAHDGPMRGVISRVLDLPSHGTAPAHRFAFWLAVLAFIAGVSNTISTSATFMTGGSVIMTPRAGPFLDWRFGRLPDTTTTFMAGLIAMGVGVGFALSAFRLFALREREVRRLDCILMLLQFQPLLWFSLRACMMIPASAGVLASVRETFGNMISFAFYISCAQPHSRGVLYVASFALVMYVVGLVDRGIEVGMFGQMQSGLYLQPAIGPDSTGRYFAYLLTTELCRCIAIWLCAEQLGSDKRSRTLFCVVAFLEPLAALSLQSLRIALHSKEIAPGNDVFVTDVFGACAIVFGYTISFHWMLYARVRCRDSLGELERRVQALNSQAAVSEAVATAQKEFTRYIFHEVRGPLNNIGLGVELLSGLPAVQQNAEMKEIVSLMGDSANIVRRITDDVLFIAKVESNQFNLIFSPFSVSDMLYSVVQQQSAPAAVKGVRLSTTVAPGIPPLLLGDGNRIRQIITNLASNGRKQRRGAFVAAVPPFMFGRPYTAIKFVPDQGGHVRLAVYSFLGQVQASDAGGQEQPSGSVGSLTFTRPTPGTIHRRNFAAGLVNGSFVRAGSRSSSAAVHPLDSTALSVIEEVPAEQARATVSNPTPWPTQLTSFLSALRPTRPSPSTHAAVAADQRIAEVGSSMYLSGDASLGGQDCPDPGLPLGAGAGDALCPHVVDLPANVVASTTVVTLRFEVQDNGRGLSEEQRRQLFKPYSQINTRRNHGGTGLGLYISMLLATQMGGRIGVDSEGEGHGATFWCEIPMRVLLQSATATPDTRVQVTSVASVEGAAQGVLAPPLQPAAPAVASALPTTAPSPTAPRAAAIITAPLEILIVDDVDSIRMLMRRLLKQHAPAAIIHEAADGPTSCEIMATAKQAGASLFSRGIICMDKEMPGSDGFAATQRIREMGFTGRIIGITGNAIAEDVAAFLACGADIVLTKPLSFLFFWIISGHFPRATRTHSDPVMPQPSSMRPEVEMRRILDFGKARLTTCRCITL